MKILYLTSNNSYPCGVSGYDRLAEFFPDRLILNYRRESKGWVDRCTNLLTRQVAVTRWAFGQTIHNELRVRRVLQSTPFDLVHVLWGERELGVVDLICRRAGVPLVASFHEPYDSGAHPLRRPARLKNLSGAIFMSDTQRKILDEHLASGAPRAVILHGIDTTAFSPRQAAESPAKFVICCAGNQRRDFGMLEKVMERLVAEPSLEFCLLVREEVKARFERFPNVSFVSGLSDPQLAQFYRQASCLLITLEAATANNSLLEAMASGLAVVSEDVGGTREYLTPGTGILVTKGDIDGIVAQVMRVRDNPALRASLGGAARARSLELAWPKVAERTSDFYAEAVAYAGRGLARRRAT